MGLRSLRRVQDRKELWLAALTTLTVHDRRPANHLTDGGRYSPRATSPAWSKLSSRQPRRTDKSAHWFPEIVRAGTLILVTYDALLHRLGTLMRSRSGTLPKRPQARDGPLRHLLMREVRAALEDLHAAIRQQSAEDRACS
jgi:hypothetical protein